MIPGARSNGYVLLTVLWVVAIASVLGLSFITTARQGIASSANRRALVELGWLAEGCAAGARQIIDELLQSADSEEPMPWKHLDALALPSLVAPEPECALDLAPDGLRIDPNTMGGSELRRFLFQHGIPGAVADSLADALLDWQDPDSVTRPFGAGIEWYRAHHRPGPRHAPLRSPAEVLWVRGFDEHSLMASQLEPDAGRIVFTRAPLPVIAALPGMTTEAVAALAVARSGGHAPTVAELAALLSGPPRDSLLSKINALTALTVSDPVIWKLRITAGVAQPKVVEELWLVLVDRSTRVLRRKVWVQ
jgi:general secretion pathway protein K